MKKRPPDATYERVKEILSYDPATGLFKWIKTLSNRAQAGNVAGCYRKDGYLVIRFDGKLYLGHRLAWLLVTGNWPKQEIDHKDGNPSNNKWGNLREATHSENITNQAAHKNNKLGLKGVK